MTHAHAASEAGRAGVFYVTGCEAGRCVLCDRLLGLTRRCVLCDRLRGWRHRCVLCDRL